MPQLRARAAPHTTPRGTPRTRASRGGAERPDHRPGSRCPGPGSRGAARVHHVTPPALVPCLMTVPSASSPDPRNSAKPPAAADGRTAAAAAAGDPTSPDDNCRRRPRRQTPRTRDSMPHGGTLEF
eukprot:CAMPEP_0206039636 /NCGR_PEP_ID=MMETSP1466-20131121/4889_1 /ASSEMBLY_ACC=CAM_ASM_001126 /TAXON_ID=44452 /ORGANISM="Pavlova gyrans, Strain CCMP608" /LENGTH=125 /DNA_ID=CAMNT_0053414285 /DNA_START=177 /DNA_END=551 /DNA_ORIENTATION=+